MITKERKMNKRGDNIEKKLVGNQDGLYHLAYMLTSDTEKAKDLLHDTILKVLTNREKYIRDTNFKGWVFRIMKNTFINSYHRDSRVYPLEDQVEKSYRINLPCESGYETPNGRYTLKEINQTIESFPKEYRISFSMYVAGYKYEEIASYMHLPLGTVKSRIYYTRKKLQILLEDYRNDY